ncbi:MAG: amylo-alpha-1,6-glucosidase [Pyrinomonadaceae bacterium]
MIRFDSEICTSYKESTEREWLETNGIGGFACGTISGTLTRRYHCLLMAANKPPIGRFSYLSKFEESIFIDGSEYQLSSNQYPGVVDPKGYKYLVDFRLVPFPVWVYEIEGVEIERRLFMIHGKNAVVCRWRVLSKVGGIERNIKLVVKPLVSFTELHAIRKENAEFSREYSSEPGNISYKPLPDSKPLNFLHNASKISATGYWYKNFELEMERERGFDFQQDLFQPFSFEFELSDNCFVAAASEHLSAFSPDQAELNEIERRDRLVEISKADTEMKRQLVLAADQFVVKRGDGNSIIAGYPWFEDWGRDTMIALPGLTLATNREGIAKSILREYSTVISEGMIPNRFPDEGETPDYNTVDATLWYFEALRAYVTKTKDFAFVKNELYEKLVEVIIWHQRGTRYSIKLDDDGLLHAGENGSQLTWMDAKVGGDVFTPRIGKPVEIQALWYNALIVMADFANEFRDKDGVYLYQRLAKKTKTAFNNNFWCDDGEYLYDVIDGGYRYKAIRPNQIFAVSLRNSMLSIYRAKKVVQSVEKYLFTPVGLRSLSPESDEYKGAYTGTPYERDSAYHQGTVWAWLTGAFIESLKKTYPNGRKMRKRKETILQGIHLNLFDAGLGQVSEIFDGNKPHKPRGCFAQAWSVAEVLRVLD